MSELARARWKFLSLAAVPAVLGAAVIAAAMTAPSAQDHAAAGVPGDEAVVHAAAHPPDPPEPPDPPAPPRAPRPWLGITMDDEEAAVRWVADGSPAEEAGVRKGDRILEVNGKKMEDSGDVVREVRSMEPGDTIKLRVDRDGKEMTLSATLEGRSSRRMHMVGPRSFEWHGDGPRAFVLGGPGPYLGVQVHPMSDDLRAFFKAPRGAGLLVNRVMEDTPAEKAGMQAGDIILSVDGNEISRVGDIGRALRDREAGDKVSVKVLRDGSERTLDVEVDLDERPGFRHRSFRWPDGDEEGLLVLPEESREEIRKAIEESLRGLRESLEGVQEEQHRIREEIRRELRDSLRDVRKARVVSTSYDI